MISRVSVRACTRRAVLAGTARHRRSSRRSCSCPAPTRRPRSGPRRSIHAHAPTPPSDDETLFDRRAAGGRAAAAARLLRPRRTRWRHTHRTTRRTARRTSWSSRARPPCVAQLSPFHFHRLPCTLIACRQPRYGTPEGSWFLNTRTGTPSTDLLGQEDRARLGFFFF